MSKLIDKLGIKPIERTDYGSGFSLVNTTDLIKSEQQKNKMLEALIGSGITNHWFSINMQRAVENVAGITWAEIKELL